MEYFYSKSAIYCNFIFMTRMHIKNSENDIKIIIGVLKIKIVLMKSAHQSCG